MLFALRTVYLEAFPGQQPGTSGLRKKVRIFQKPGYTEAFLQSVFDALDDKVDATIVIGGDGRYYNNHVLQLALRSAAANQIGRVVVGCDGILSTPAVSHLIRTRGAVGGLILSASHNPGGPEEDFGIKYNIGNGGPAPEFMSERIYRNTQVITRYLTIEAPAVDLSRCGVHKLGEMTIEVIDPVCDYADLMETLIDFSSIRKAALEGLTMRFDAMHAVTGPYAIEIFERRLGFTEGTVVNATPLSDFGGLHPDPNLVHAAELNALMLSSNGPAFGAASDGDGDRNLVFGRGGYVTPSDAIAVLAANAHLAPAYRSGLKGVARSMPTSAALDRVAEALGIPIYETPTGWKFFGNLLDAGLVTLCGEESAGAGADHIREKDGLWAVLLWLNILAERGQPIDEIVKGHWAQYGRNYYCRYDYEDVDGEVAEEFMSSLRGEVNVLVGRRITNLLILQADDFSYEDPVDGSVSSHQGLRVLFEGGARVVYRLSGTGTAGATLRVYYERYEPPSGDLAMSAATALAGLIAAGELLTGLQRRLGREAPDVVT